jgi:hypothetical protein
MSWAATMALAGADYESMNAQTKRNAVELSQEGVGSGLEAGLVKIPL